MFSRKAGAVAWPKTQRVGVRCTPRGFEQRGVYVCNGAWSRTRGLLGRPEDSSALLFPCGSVHTIGMRRAIDVIYLSRAARVVRIVSALRPLRASVGPRGSFAVLEVPASSGRMLQVGDELEWMSEEEQA